MRISVTFVGLRYENLNKVLKVSIERMKLLGSCVQREVRSERLRVRRIIVNVSVVEVCMSSMLYVLLCVTSCRRAKIEGEQVSCVG